MTTVHRGAVKDGISIVLVNDSTTDDSSPCSVHKSLHDVNGGIKKSMLQTGLKIDGIAKVTVNILDSSLVESANGLPDHLVGSTVGALIKHLRDDRIAADLTNGRHVWYTGADKDSRVLTMGRDVLKPVRKLIQIKGIDRQQTVQGAESQKDLKIGNQHVESAVGQVGIVSHQDTVITLGALHCRMPKYVSSDRIYSDGTSATTGEFGKELV